MSAFLSGAAYGELYAQSNEITVTGKVLDSEGQPLPSATIRIAGTSRGAVTSADGSYSIRVKRGETIEALFMGYETQSAKIAGNRSVYDFTLTEDEMEAMRALNREQRFFVAFEDFTYEQAEAMVLGVGR